MAPVQSDHPRRNFVWRVEGPTDIDAEAERLERLIDRLAATRTWTIAPPEFIDDEDPGDENFPPLRIIGGVLEIYSGLPPWGERLPTDVDRAQLEEVRSVVDALREFSAARDLTIALELDGDSTGWIERGNPDELITVALLGEWERVLRERESRA